MSFNPDGTAIEQAAERSFSSKNGWQTVRRFKGSQASIEAKADELAALGYDIRVRYGPVCEVEATIGQDVQGDSPQFEVPVYTWELSGNAIEADMLKSEADTVKYLPAEDILILRDLLDGRETAQDYTVSSPAFISTRAIDLWQLWQAGIKSIQSFQPTLRRSYTVSRQAQISSSLLGVGKVWSTGSLVSVENIPAAVAINLPESGDDSRPGLGGQNQFYRGWLKAYPQIQIAWGNKAQVSQEWQWGLWAVALYEIHA